MYSFLAFSQAMSELDRLMPSFFVVVVVVVVALFVVFSVVLEANKLLGIRRDNYKILVFFY